MSIDRDIEILNDLRLVEREAVYSSVLKVIRFWIEIMEKRIRYKEPLL